MPKISLYPHSPRHVLSTKNLLEIPGFKAMLRQATVVMTELDRTQLCRTGYLWVERTAREVVTDPDDPLDGSDIVLVFGTGWLIDRVKMATRGKQVWCIPTAITTNAMFHGRVHYIKEGGVFQTGDADAPWMVVLDQTLLNGYPRGNRSGAGDVLAFITSLYDWGLLANQVDNTIMVGDTEILEMIIAKPDNLDILSDCLDKMTLNQIRWGNSQPNCGSEHLLANQVEALGRDGLLHGETVGLSVKLMYALQGRDDIDVSRVLKQFGLPSTLAEAGVPAELFARALANVRPREGRHTVFDYLDIDPEEARRLVKENLS